MRNFTYWMENLVELSMQGYITAFGFFFYPLLFSFIIAYVYLKLQSAVAAVIVILIIMAVFGNALMGVEAWVTVMHLFTALVITGLVLLFVSKRRGV